MRFEPLDRTIRLRQAGLQLDAELDLLAPPGVGHCYGGNVGDLRQHLHDGLDLARRYVLAAAPDHFLDAADDVVVAALVAAEEIAGAEPVVAERRRCRLLVVPVALEDRAAG